VADGRPSQFWKKSRWFSVRNDGKKRRKRLRS